MSGCFLLLASLACTLGNMAASEPLFTPPGQVILWTDTPLPPEGNSETLPPTSTSIPINYEEPQATPTASPTNQEVLFNTTPFLYYTQAGDTLPVLAVRFGVEPHEITSPEAIPETSLFNPGQLLIIPRKIANTTAAQKLIPDSEVVYSPSAVDFDIEAFAREAGGFLGSYWTYLGSTGRTSGAGVVARVALENSINPRLLLALLEYESGLVYGSPRYPNQIDYALGKVDPRHKGLYNQLSWAVVQLSNGYYGWREGRLTEFNFSDGVHARLHPELNAGTAALQYFFAQSYDSQGWLQALDPEAGFPALYERMFDNPWVRALAVEPLYPPDLVQPPLILPFMVDQVWSFSGGPHGAWEREGAWAAIDFAPGSVEPGCVESNTWTVAAASGLVVRSGNGVVVLDLDGDGREQTGWVLVYLHVATKGRIKVGEWVQTGDPLGHPSCEGGFSTGTHIHLARKYNGEWIVADGPMPFMLSGWTVRAGKNPYEGSMVRDEQVVIASQLGSTASHIMRRAGDP